MRQARTSDMKAGYGRRTGLLVMVATVVAAVLVVAPAATGAAAPKERTEVQNPKADREALESLQRWVNGGHDAWCKDAREVALVELRMVAPEFAGDRFDLTALPLKEDATAAKKAVFAWAAPDGSVRIRVTVERYEWLKALTKSEADIVWMPTRVEIVREEEAPARSTFAEIPRA